MSTPAVSQLTTSEAKILSAKIKAACVAAHDGILDAGRMLATFRDRGGWSALGYASWTACVDEEFKSTHGGRRHVFSLIQNAEVAKNIITEGQENGQNRPLSASTTTKAGGTRATGSGLPIRQTQQLAKAPPELQAKALEIAIELGGGTATEATIKRAVEQLKPVKEIHRDDTGYAIPEKILPLWNRRGEVKDALRAISQARVTLKAAMDSEDILYSAVSVNGILSRLNLAYSELQPAMPHAVCPTCQGQVPASCRLCKGRGLIGKFHYDRVVPEELKAIRAKSCVQ